MKIFQNYKTYNKMSTTIVILGNIGSGKSTMTRKLSDHLKGSTAIYEPIDQWRLSGILDLYYKNQEKLAGMFQVYTLSSRIASIFKATEKVGLYVCDSHIVNDRRVFKEALKTLKCIDKNEELIYEETYKYWSEILADRQGEIIFVYIESPPEKCLENIKKRNRTEEVEIKLSFLELLDEKYKDLYMSLSEEAHKIIKVDGSKEENEVFMDIRDKIQNL
jgi:deoxyadenosine/deoxycytidine kinase